MTEKTIECINHLKRYFDLKNHNTYCYIMNRAQTDDKFSYVVNNIANPYKHNPNVRGQYTEGCLIYSKRPKIKFD